MESPLLLEPPATGFGLELARILAVQLRTSVQENWRELRAIEEQAEAITAEFDGEDVMKPRVRQCFDEARATLGDVHGQLQEYTGPFELPEPGEDVRALVQRIIDNEVADLQTIR